MNSIIKFIGIALLVFCVSWFLSEIVIYKDVNLQEYSWEKQLAVDLNGDGSNELLTFRGEKILNDRVDSFMIICNEQKNKGYGTTKFTDITKHHIYIGDIENDGIKEIFIEGVNKESEKYPIYTLDVYKYLEGSFIYCTTIEKGKIKYNTVMDNIKIYYEIENQETKEITKKTAKHNKIKIK